MASWLTRLSLAFVVSGATAVGYVVLRGDSEIANTYRPALAEFFELGRSALGAITAGKGPIEPKAERDQAKLPFIVIEPRDFAAPVIKLPQGGEHRLLAQPVSPRHLQSSRHQTLSSLPSALDLNPIERRLRVRVPAEVIGYFDLFLYVSKAKPEKGDWAQRMFVLAKDQDQSLRLLHLWKVSTGREEPMPSPSGKMLGTETPQGMFKLDRNRFHVDYRSRQWDSPMPYAMFFDWRIDGRVSGLAIHGTDVQGEAELGQRASHGCIRLSTDNARTLFELIRENYQGRVPRFEINADTGTMSTSGALVRDEDGRVVMTNGYKALVFIEDYGGPSVDTVAALY